MSGLRTPTDRNKSTEAISHVEKHIIIVLRFIAPAVIMLPLLAIS
jgi:hypothetical protein